MVLRPMLRDPLATHDLADLVRKSGLPTGAAQSVLGRLDAAGWLSRSQQGDAAALDERERPARSVVRFTAQGAAAAREALARPRPAVLVVACAVGAVAGVLLGVGAHGLGVGAVPTGIVAGVCAGAVGAVRMTYAYPGTSATLAGGACVGAATGINAGINVLRSPAELTADAFVDAGFIAGPLAGVGTAIVTMLVVLAAAVLIDIRSMTAPRRGPDGNPPVPRTHPAGSASTEGFDDAGQADRPDILASGPSPH